MTNGQAVLDPATRSAGEPAAAGSTRPGPACRAILLDFGGTLDADGLPWRERMRALYRGSGLAVEPARFDLAFHAADDALVGGVPRALGLASTVELLVAGLHRGLGLPDDGRAEAIARRFAEDTLARAGSRRPLLRALGRRYRLAVVSNFYGNLEAVCEEAGIRSCFAAVVDSEVVGFEKPDARIFRAALVAVGAAPGEALFVGDSLPRDMAGAREIGMPHMWLAAGSGTPCCPGDRVIGALAELEALLR
jgi:HAD superfamily hydrolase (TIGR01509 family)